MMRRVLRFTLSLGALTLAVIALGACRQAEPIPAVIPPPTASPTPIPEPTGIERLAWFHSPPDTAHWISWAALRRISFSNEALSAEMAALPWVADGISAEEAGVLDDFSWLLREAPDVADTVLGLPLMSVAGAVSADDRRAFRAIRAAADVDDGLGSTLASYSWIPDGASDDETTALEELARIVAPDFETRTASGIGASRMGVPGVGIPPAVSADTIELAQRVADYLWMQDAVSILETDAISQLGRLITETGDDHADAMRTVVSYIWVSYGMNPEGYESLRELEPLFERAASEDAQALETMLDFGWMEDSIDDNEGDALRALADLLGSQGAGFRVYRDTILNYDWVSDDVDRWEARGIEHLVDSVEALAAENPRALSSVLTYDWVRDGIVIGDVVPLRSLATIFDSHSAETADFISALAERPWLQDDLDSIEGSLLSTYAGFLEGRHGGDVTLPPTLATFPWLDDVISGIERDYIRDMLDFVNDVTPLAPDTVAALLENAHAESPDSSDYGRAGLRDAHNTITNAQYLHGDEVASSVARLPWLLDGISRTEGRWLDEYMDLLLILQGQDDELAASIPIRPWAQDSITTDEIEWTHQFRRFIEEARGEARQNTFSAGSVSWFQDNINARDANMMGLMARVSLDDPSFVVGEEWLTTEIGEEEFVTLFGLIEARRHPGAQYRDLLRQSHVAHRTIAFPLAGDVDLYVIRHTEFPRNDPTLDLFEEVALRFEKDTGTPFPHNPIMAYAVELGSTTGQGSDYTVSPYAAEHMFVFSPPDTGRRYFNDDLYYAIENMLSR